MNPNTIEGLPITIVMYHYVRELKGSRFPRMKALEVEDFSAQIKFFKDHYNIITMEQFLCYLDKKEKLPDRALLLTFDDGYKDHLQYVLPILLKCNVQGSFYAPSEAIRHRNILDVYAIHAIIASADDHHLLGQRILDLLPRYREEFVLKQDKDYLKDHKKQGRYDPPETVFVKFMLQSVLPKQVRKEIISILLEEFLSFDLTQLADEFYLTAEELLQLQSEGMHVGLHGHTHTWLNLLSREEQKKEILDSLDFFHSIGIRTEGWTITYPYGGHNQETIDLVGKLGCKAAFRDNSDIAQDNIQEERFQINRLDTNLFPKRDYLVSL